MKDKEITKQLTVVIPLGIFNRLKLMGINHNCSLKAIVMRALVEAIAKEEAVQ